MIMEFISFNWMLEVCLFYDIKYFAYPLNDSQWHREGKLWNLAVGIVPGGGLAS